MILVLFVATLVLTVVLAASVAGPDRRARDAVRWAVSEGVALDATTTPVVEGYLGTSRHLRQIGFVGGLVVAPAATAATGVDLGLPGLLWALVGYLLGCLWAELALTRRPVTARRTASLTVRRVGDYLPRAMAGTQGAAVAVAAVLALVGATIDPASVDPWAGGWSVGDDAADLQRSAVLAGVLAPAAMVAVALAQQRIVRRPQPLQVPEHLAVDDAMRSSAVRLLGATGIAMAAVLVALQVAWLATAVGGGAAAAAGSAATVVLLLGLVQWRWWPHRGWAVRRPGAAPPARPVTSVPAGSTPQGGPRG